MVCFCIKMFIFSSEKAFLVRLITQNGGKFYGSSLTTVNLNIVYASKNTDFRKKTEKSIKILPLG